MDFWLIIMVDLEKWLIKLQRLVIQWSFRNNYCFTFKYKTMFDQILEMVKEHLGNNPQVTSQLSPEQQDALHKEVAGQITTGLATEAPKQGGVGGLLDSLKNAATSGGPVTGAIEGGLISSLTSKMGLPPAVTGAIAGALPGLLQKFAQKVDDPNDDSITPDSLNESLSNFDMGSLGDKIKGGLSGFFNKN